MPPMLSVFPMSGDDLCLTRRVAKTIAHTREMQTSTFNLVFSLNEVKQVCIFRACAVFVSTTMRTSINHHPTPAL